jgi:hypothetical protein
MGEIRLQVLVFAISVVDEYENSCPMRDSPVRRLLREEDFSGSLVNIESPWKGAVAMQSLMKLPCILSYHRVSNVDVIQPVDQIFGDDK